MLWLRNPQTIDKESNYSPCESSYVVLRWLKVIEMKMKGNVKAYSEAVNAGIIEGNDGLRYQFGRSEWNGTLHPASNDAEVSFNAEGKRATQVTDGKLEKPGKKK